MDTSVGMLVVRMEGSEVYAEETHIEQVHFPLQKRRHQYKCVYWVYFGIKSMQSSNKDRLIET